MELLTYKFLFIGFFLIFLKFGYDMKVRADWKNLAPSKSTQLMKLGAILLALILIVTMATIDQIEISTKIALVCIILGAILVTFAKRELEKHHAFTWTGYVLEKPKLVTSGVYSIIRHPLYLGVYLTEIGGSLLVLNKVAIIFPEDSFLISTILILILFYAVLFNAILAGKESKNLENIFGNDYVEYSSKVHSIIPFYFKIFRISKR